MGEMGKKKKRKKPEVLIVDDEVNITLSMVEFLGKKLDCYGAYSYEEAVSFLSKHPVDLVISDIKLPGRDGFDLLMWIRKNLPRTRVILITAYGSPTFKEKAKRKGALLYIEKPVDLNQLIRIIGKMFEKKGFEAAISDLELVDILQFLSFYDRDLIVHVENHIGQRGEIGIKNGKVMWAKTEDLRGMDAFMEIMRWEGGDFTTDDYKDSEDGKIEESIMYLILEASRVKDEDLNLNSVEIVIEENNNRKNKGGKEMAALNEILEKFKSEIPEFLSTDIIRIEEGLSVGGGSIDPNFDASAASALYSEVVKANKKALELLGGADNVGETEDILVSTDKIYVLMRMLGEKHFQGLAITRKGNVGLARVIMKKYEPLFLEALKELGEL